MYEGYIKMKIYVFTISIYWYNQKYSEYIFKIERNIHDKKLNC